MRIRLILLQLLRIKLSSCTVSRSIRVSEIRLTEVVIIGHIFFHFLLLLLFFLLKLFLILLLLLRIVVRFHIFLILHLLDFRELMFIIIIILIILVFLSRVGNFFICRILRSRGYRIHRKSLLPVTSISYILIQITF